MILIKYISVVDCEHLMCLLSHTVSSTDAHKFISGTHESYIYIYKGLGSKESFQLKVANSLLMYASQAAIYIVSLM